LSKQPQVTAKLALDNAPMKAALSKSKLEFDKFNKDAGQRLKAGFAAVGAAAGGAVAMAIDGIRRNANLEYTELALKSFMGSADKARDAVAMLRAEAQQRPIFKLDDMMAAGQALSTFAGGSVGKLKGLVEMAERLSLLNKEEGMRGAAFSLKEALSGDYASLIERFNVSRSRINELKAMGMEGQQIVAKILSEMGVSEQTLDDFGGSFAGMLATLRSNYETFVTEMGGSLFKELQPKLNELVEYLKANQGAINEAAAGIGTALTAAVKAALQASQVIGTMGASSGGWWESMISNKDRDLPGAGKAFLQQIGLGLGAGAAKLNQGLWKATAINPVTGWFFDQKWLKGKADKAGAQASWAWNEISRLDGVINDKAGITKANAAADQAAADHIEQNYLGQRAQVGKRVTGQQSSTVNVNLNNYGTGHASMGAQP